MSGEPTEPINPVTLVAGQPTENAGQESHGVANKSLLPRKYGWRTAYARRALESTQAKLVTTTAERDRAQEKALTDPLTGILSLEGFNKRLTAEINRAEREKMQIAVMVFDLNGLKEVNDTLGHAIGDQRIITAADILTSSFRPTDLVARRGTRADEFIVALEVDNLEQVKEYYQRVTENSRPLSEYWDGSPMVLPAGAAILDFNNIDGSMRNADKEMYTAKGASKLSNQNTISLSSALPGNAV